MARIANYSVSVWKGRLRPAQRVITIASATPGRDGQLAAIGAWRSPRSGIATLVELSSSSETAARRLTNLYRKLEGTTVSVVDQWGREYSNVFIARAVADHFASGKGSSTFVVRGEWTMYLPAEEPNAS